MVAAIVMSALVFALAHLPNEGISVQVIAAGTAYAVMQAALYMKTHRLGAALVPTETPPEWGWVHMWVF